MKGMAGEDYYFEKGLMVMTARYHLKRGYCCGSGCRHCPFDPRHHAGATAVAGRSSDASDKRSANDDEQFRPCLKRHD